MVSRRFILVAAGSRVVLIKVIHDCTERFLGLVTDYYHIDMITRSKEQKFYLYQIATELRSRMKKIGEKKGLSKKLIKQMNHSL